MIYLDTPEGQLSWHLAPEDLDLFQHVPSVEPDHPAATFDGHTTDLKYERIRNLTIALITRASPPPAVTTARTGRAVVGVRERQHPPIGQPSRVRYLPLPGAAAASREAWPAKARDRRRPTWVISGVQCTLGVLLGVAALIGAAPRSSAVVPS